MKQLFLFSSFLIMTTLFTACCATKKLDTSAFNNPVAGIPGPKAIIYKTKKDYAKLVPIVLSRDKKTIESYPDIKDVFYQGYIAYPTQLHDGFLLDNRGISENVAFINITYEAYSKLKNTPTSKELMKMVIDKKPLKSMYSCGLKSAYQNIEQELNDKIDAGDFSTFTKLK